MGLRRTYSSFLHLLTLKVFSRAPRLPHGDRPEWRQRTEGQTHRVPGRVSGKTSFALTPPFLKNTSHAFSVPGAPGAPGAAPAGRRAGRTVGCQGRPPPAEPFSPSERVNRWAGHHLPVEPTTDIKALRSARGRGGGRSGQHRSPHLRSGRCHTRGLGHAESRPRVQGR